MFFTAEVEFLIYMTSIYLLMTVVIGFTLRDVLHLTANNEMLFVEIRSNITILTITIAFARLSAGVFQKKIISQGG